MRHILAALLIAAASPVLADEPIVITNFESPLSDIVNMATKERLLDCRVRLLTAQFGMDDRGGPVDLATCEALVTSFDSLDESLADIIKMSR